MSYTLSGTYANDVALVLQPDTALTGTITATDILAPIQAGNGVLVNVAPTVNSFFAAAIPGGTGQANIQILGTPTGTYYFESSTDSTNGSDGNWTATNYRLTGVTNTQLGYLTTVGGVFRGAPSGFKFVRVRNVGGSSPNNAIIVRYAANPNTVFLNASIPAGTNNIGSTAMGPPQTSVQASATGAAAALAPAMAGVALKTNYLTGFEVTMGGAVAGSLISVTITGLLGGTITYLMAVPAGVTLAAPMLSVEFTTPLPASAVNTAITLNVPSGGAGNTNAAANIHGFVQ